MADGTKIEWTDATVNAVNGCTVLSPGCKHCYAMKQAHRFDVRRGLTQKTAGGMVWTGEVRFNEKALLQPLAWKRPRRIFWNAHGDLFHENVPDAWIDKVFAVCALTPQHRHQILTKRSARMRKYMNDPHTPFRVARAILDLAIDDPALLRRDAWPVVSIGNIDEPDDVTVAWPLLSVWLGVSVEDQKRADERREDFANTRAVVKFVSYEPALGPVDWTYWDFVDQIIGGGESGSCARPMHPDWQRVTLDFCARHDIAYFFKQWGEWLPWEPEHGPDWKSQLGDIRDRHSLPDFNDTDLKGWTDACLYDGHDICVHERVGKKAAGRLLDGFEHNGMPTL